MTLYTLCHGESLRCCATCRRNADNVPAERVGTYQAWLTPYVHDGKCNDWSAMPDQSLHGRWDTSKFIGVCAEIEPITDGTTGATTYRLKHPQVNVTGTIACPPSFTVASATAHFAALPDPITGSGSGFMQGH